MGCHALLQGIFLTQIHISCISCIGRQVLYHQRHLGNSILCIAAAAAAAKSLHSCPTLCDPIDCSPPGSPVQGILQARTLEWVAMPSSRGSSQSRDQTQVSHIARHLLLYDLCRPHRIVNINCTSYILNEFKFSSDIILNYRIFSSLLPRHRLFIH